MHGFYNVIACCNCTCHHQSNYNTLTFPGNLTLFGSVANLIVAQKAQESVDYHLTFWTYLRYGLPSTLLTLTVGILLIYGLLLI